MRSRAHASRLRALSLSTREVAGAGGWLLLGAVVSRGAAVVAVVAVSRIIDPDEFGRLAIMQTAVLTAAAIAGFGLPMAVTRQVADVRAADAETAGRYIGTAIAVTAAGVTAIAVLCLAGRTFVADVLLGDAGLSSLVPAAVAAVIGLALFGIAQASLAGVESFTSVALAQAVQAALTAAGLVVGALAGGALGALAGLAAGHAVAAGWTLFRVWRETARASLTVRLGLARQAGRALARYAFPAFVAALVVSAALLGGQLLLAAEPNGYADVAAFSVAYRWHLAIIFIPAAAAPALVPILTRQRRQDQAQARRTLLATLAATAVIAIVPAALVAALAPLVLKINGDFYAAHPLPLVILAIAAVPCALNGVMSGAALSYGSVGSWLLSDVVLALALLIAAALLIPSLQASGLALAYLIAYVLTNLALVPALARHLRPSP